MAKISVCNDKYITAFPNPKAQTNGLKVCDLEEALLAQYKTDAHLSLYYSEEEEYHPRILKVHLKEYPKPIKVGCFFADIDNEQHERFTDETLKESIKNIPDLEGLGIYYTSRGYRLFQPLEEALLVSEVDVEAHMLEWLLGLEKRGFPVDFNCRDISRFFRLPNIVRDNVKFISPHIDFSKIKPLKIDILDLPLNIDSNIKSYVKKPAVINLITNWKSELPKKYDDIAKVIAKDLSRIQDPWHPIFLGIAGALYSKGVESEYLPSLCQRISYYTGKDDKPQDRFRIGADTVNSRKNKIPTRGFPYLKRYYPTLVNAINLAFEENKNPNESKIYSDIESTYDNLKETIKNADKEITVIKAITGLGKTNASIEVAAERNSENLKTGISVDKNILAKQVADDLKNKQGIDGYRIFGSSSYKDSSGNFECIHSEISKTLSNSGQSILWELCRGRDKHPCENFDSCNARKGFEGEESSNIVISNHNKLNEIISEVTTKGMIIVDEPKSFVVTHSIKREQLEIVKKRISDFEYGFIQHIKNYINRVINLEVPEEEIEIEKNRKGEFFREMITDIDISGIDQFPTKHKRGVPPIKGEINLLSNKKEIVEELAITSKIIYLLYRAFYEKSLVVINKNSIDITLYDEDMYKILKHTGRVIITDANADLYIDQIKAITENTPEFLEFKGKDNVEFERQILKFKGATRTNWIKGKNIIFENKLKDCFYHIIKWRSEKHKWKVKNPKIAIITFVQIEELIKQKDERIPNELFDIDFITGHYYNLRGMNNYMDCDGLVTLGDPYKNKDAIEKEFIFFNFSLDKCFEYSCKVAQAELEQAHGRLRPSRRTKHGRSLHIGNLIPSGEEWKNVLYRKEPRASRSTVTKEEINYILKEKKITQAELSKILRIDQSNLSKFLRGQILSLSLETEQKIKKII